MFTGMKWASDNGVVVVVGDKCRKTNEDEKPKLNKPVSTDVG